MRSCRDSILGDGIFGGSGLQSLVGEESRAARFVALAARRQAHRFEQIVESGDATNQRLMPGRHGLP